MGVEGTSSLMAAVPVRRSRTLTPLSSTDRTGSMRGWLRLLWVDRLCGGVWMHCRAVFKMWEPQHQAKSQWDVAADPPCLHLPDVAWGSAGVLVALLVSCGYCNKRPQAGWLQIAERYSFSLEAASVKSRCLQAWDLLRLQGSILSASLFLCSINPAVLSCHRSTSFSAPVVMCHWLPSGMPARW